MVNMVRFYNNQRCVYKQYVPTLGCPKLIWVRNFEKLLICSCAAPMPLVETVIHAKFQEDLKIFRGRARSPLFPIEKQWKEEKALLQ